MAPTEEKYRRLSQLAKESSRAEATRLLKRALMLEADNAKLEELAKRSREERRGLISALEASDSARERMRAALEKYAGHLASCAAVAFADHPMRCDCGFTEALAAVLAEMGTPCVWRPDDDGWASSCGNFFVIIDGTPADNEMRYCYYCGHPIKEERL